MMSRNKLSLITPGMLAEYSRSSRVPFRRNLDGAVVPANDSVAEGVEEEFGRRHDLHPKSLVRALCWQDWKHLFNWAIYISVAGAQQLDGMKISALRRHRDKLSWSTNIGGTNRREHHEIQDCCRRHCGEPRLHDHLSICRPSGEHGHRHAHRTSGLRSSGGGCGCRRGLYCRPWYCTLLGIIAIVPHAVTEGPAKRRARCVVGPRAEK